MENVQHYRAMGSLCRQLAVFDPIPQPACQGCARYCVVGALDILRGCAARRSWPEGLIADLLLMITSALNGKTCRRLQRTAPARGGRAARPRMQTASQEKSSIPGNRPVRTGPYSSNK